MHGVIMLDYDWKWYSNFVKKKKKRRKSDIRIMWCIIIRKSLGVNYGLDGKNTNVELAVPIP